ncbi:MAG: S46 family peptidase, partial [Crocinitomicaceae bacterium]|nr:S46 family peptidase [Crocinitomicaceae bacterium]
LIMKELHDGMDEDERALAAKKAGQAIAEKEVEGTHYNAYVKDFFGGNEYYLFVVEVFEDIRMVGAPPSAIGKFGGDTDNWMWERQTGDFSMFRIYAGKDNKPAKFAMDNQPYVPKHYFPISIAGIEEGDFSMVMGYPGTTNRYLTSYGVKMALEKDQPKRVEIRGKKLAIMKEHMDQNDLVRLQYASTYAQVSNYWKYFIGQQEQLKKNNVFMKKVAIEQEFAGWVSQDEARKTKYGNVLKDMEEAYKIHEKYITLKVYYSEAISSLGLSRFMLRHGKVYAALSAEQPDMAIVKDELAKVANYIEGFYSNFDYDTEAALYMSMLQMYNEAVPADQHPQEFKDVAAKITGDYNWQAFVKEAFANSIFTKKDKYLAFAENPSLETLKNDVLYSTIYRLSKNFGELVYGNESSGAQLK